MRRKRHGRAESGCWHHRVPDFELVYCGPDRPSRNLRHKFGEEVRLSEMIGVQAGAHVLELDKKRG